MFIDQYKVIHCVGIGGIGISAIAKFLLVHGKTVTGSDAFASNITRELETRGVKVSIGHAAENLPADADLVVYTEAAPEDNLERAEAKRRGITQLGHFDFLGELSKEYRTICVTGTNGKSTTTAMTGLIFEAAQLDPTVFVGSLVPGWKDGNVRIGRSDILI
ncbi:MAG: Mur ligase domain-containing protein, partial [Patescibacteria group bacterium]